MENNCQHGESCLHRASSTLLPRGEGFKQLTGMETWKSRGAAVSTLLEPNLLVQSCVKNVRDLFQALSRCGFTSVNPFTHRSSAVRPPHVTGSAGSLARPHWARAVPVLDMAELSGPVLGEVPTKPCGFHLILAADWARPACSPVWNRLCLSLSLFGVFTLPICAVALSRAP